MKRNIKEFLSRLLLVGIFVSTVFAFWGIAYALRSLQDATAYAKKMLVDEYDHINAALFSPDDNIKVVLCGLIAEEKRKISIAAYMLTDRHVTHALLAALDRGVEIEIVADGEMAVGDFSKIFKLKERGASIYIYHAQHKSAWHKSLEKPGFFTPKMHNKFIIFNDTILGKEVMTTGSYNYTETANNKNEENALFIEDSKLIARYKERFEMLKVRCKKLKSKKFTSSCAIPQPAH